MLCRHAGSVKFGLAVWLLVVTTSPAFSHEHPEGDKPHAHGLGLFSASAFACFGYDPDNGVAPDTRHCHIVIFGIEIHVPASCPWAADQDSPLPAEQAYFQLGAEIVNGLQAQAPEPSSKAAALPTPLAASISVPLDTRADEATVSPLVSFAHLCDLARGLRSGAQQV
jgi:hypothetical protein